MPTHTPSTTLEKKVPTAASFGKVDTELAAGPITLYIEQVDSKALLRGSPIRPGGQVDFVAQNGCGRIHFLNGSPFTGKGDFSFDSNCCAPRTVRSDVTPGRDFVFEATVNNVMHRLQLEIAKDDEGVSHLGFAWDGNKTILQIYQQQACSPVDISIENRVEEDIELELTLGDWQSALGLRIQTGATAELTVPLSSCSEGQKALTVRKSPTQSGGTEQIDIIVSPP